MFHLSFVCLNVCAFAFKSKVYCGSAPGQGASGLPYSNYCTPFVCVPDVIGGLTVWWHHNTQKNRGGGRGFPQGFQWENLAG